MTEALFLRRCFVKIRIVRNFLIVGPVSQVVTVVFGFWYWRTYVLNVDLVRFLKNNLL
jgi:hypothetical protein